MFCVVAKLLLGPTIGSPDGGKKLVSFDDNSISLNGLGKVGRESNSRGIFEKKSIILSIKGSTAVKGFGTPKFLAFLSKDEKFSWPKVNTELLKIQKIKMAVQINGKTRSIIEIKNNSEEKFVTEECKKIKNLANYFKNNKVKKTIFVRNKIINYIIG